MKPTNVILRQNVPNLGDAGDLVTVKPGFARNYLLPRGLAFEATAGKIRRLEEEKQQTQTPVEEQVTPEPASTER